MAKLQSDDLILEINFDKFEDDWIAYKIKFYWKGDIIVKDDILKRTGEYWGKRDYGTFLANDYKKDYLIDIIKKALDTNNYECWEPIEPDAKVAIYPGRFFPFVKTPYNLFEEMEEIRLKKMEENNKEEDDLFTVMTFIDQYNFKDSQAYSGEGISLHMVVTRKDLERFVEVLETEYNGPKKG